MKKINLNTLRNLYWLKAELINFCKSQKMSTLGSKEELLVRIEEFLVTGKKSKPLRHPVEIRDSCKKITRETLVKNYKNDLATRIFFTNEIGAHFSFNAYLRQFTDKANITPGLTYGDLVDGWLHGASLKISTQSQSVIGKQFEYNQFIRDFFANEKSKSLVDAIAAWRIVKSLQGSRTYLHYKNRNL